MNNAKTKKLLKQIKAGVARSQSCVAVIEEVDDCIGFSKYEWDAWAEANELFYRIDRIHNYMLFTRSLSLLHSSELAEMAKEKAAERRAELIKERERTAEDLYELLNLQASLLDATKVSNPNPPESSKPLTLRQRLAELWGSRRK